MDRQPVLRAELVTIRPLMAEDWDTLYAVACDPLIWEVHPAKDRWQEPVFRKFFGEALACGGGLAILDNADGTIIGSSRYDTAPGRRPRWRRCSSPAACCWSR